MTRLGRLQTPGASLSGTIDNIISHLSIPSVIPDYFRNSSPATLSGVKKRNIFNPEHPDFTLGVLSERRDEIKATRCLR
jgi:hypothetical protein